MQGKDKDIAKSMRSYVIGNTEGLRRS